MDELTDAEALAASVADPTAFAVVFDRHAGTLFRFLVRRVGPDEAEDLLGEVFRIAFERRRSYDAARPEARPWLYGIAANLVARHRRSEGRRLRAMARLLSAGVPAAEDGFQRATDAMAAAGAAPAVLAAVAALPDGERDALVLHAWEQLSYEDVAAALGIPVGTVRSRLNRARGRLRELFDAAGEQPPDRLVLDHPPHPALFRRQKEQLMSTVRPTPPAAPVPKPTATRMYPRLAYRDEVAALEYLTRVFGFTEQREARMGAGGPDDPMLAWLEFGDGIVMIGRAGPEVERIHRIFSPADVGRATALINVDVVNIDDHYGQAVAAGADITMPLQDAFYGSRRYEASDLEGNRWHFSETFESIRARGGDVPGDEEP